MPPARPNGVGDLRPRAEPMDEKGKGESEDVNEPTDMSSSLYHLSRCRHRASHLGALLRVVEAPHDHLALGGLADVFRGVLEVVGEEGESCGTFDGVDCARVREQSYVSTKGDVEDEIRVESKHTWHDKTLERDVVGNGRVWEDERAGGDLVDVGRRG